MNIGTWNAKVNGLVSPPSTDSATFVTTASTRNTQHAALRTEHTGLHIIVHSTQYTAQHNTAQHTTHSTVENTVHSDKSK